MAGAESGQVQRGRNLAPGHSEHHRDIAFDLQIRASEVLGQVVQLCHHVVDLPACPLQDTAGAAGKTTPPATRALQAVLASTA
ncbi:hypothetical protein [Micromonospora chersina]